MFDDPLLIVVAVAILVVVAILLFGIASFGRGGEFDRRHANRIMRWRVGAQAVAIVVILIVVWLRKG